MKKDYPPVMWDAALEDDCRQLVRLAVREDLDRQFDVTTLALVEPETRGQATVVAREAGIACGLKAARAALDEMEIAAEWQVHAGEGDSVDAGTALATLAGSARDLLTAERLMLNLIGRLSGVATLTHEYVTAIAGTSARIYDTRKTTPGWRRMEKHAVRCGGGRNHRAGLYDAVLIKDNHLALVGDAANTSLSPGEAVQVARRRLRDIVPDGAESMIIEVEVDSLQQLDNVLPARPDIVLLDNMTLSQLRGAVERRNAVDTSIDLEASGGVRLDTVQDIAQTGVDRISVGALTHSAMSLDVALDWRNRGDT